MFLSFGLALAVCAAAPAAFGIPIAAFAQEVATSTKVDVAPIVDGFFSYVSAALSAVVALAIGFISARLYSWLGINIEARHREALHSAIMTGANAALARVADLIGGKAVDVKSTAVAEAVNYVLGAVPDAVKFFGLTEAKLSEMVAAKLQSQFAFVEPVQLSTTETAG
ncbi:MAG: hypothetical protein DI527_16270 [Chelatococcus sp.]|nr:MAG: hypothetical protein DI527_16270 [Chelatococcus sp.]